jgi:transcriptional regulator with XRE-family HTH domain
MARPEDQGMPAPGHRRVAGLRREEVAMLAGLSTDYYVRLEQGRERHPSPQVLDALADALRLDDEAGAHLHGLARPTAHRRRETHRPERVSASLLGPMERWPHTPALLLGCHMDVLAANSLGSALFSWLGGEPDARVVPQPVGSRVLRELTPRRRSRRRRLVRFPLRTGRTADRVPERGDSHRPGRDTRRPGPADHRC